jgi:hypothetical protein
MTAGGQEATMGVRPYAAALVAAFAASLAGATELASITKPELRTLSARVFTLDREQEVRVEGVAADVSGSWSPARMWVLDAATRKLVWDVTGATLEKPRHGLARFSAAVRLPAGDYELYLATFPGTSGTWDRRGVNVHELLGRLQEALDLDGLEDVITELSVTVTGDGTAGGDGMAGAIRQRLERGAAAAVLGVGDDADESAGFALRAPAKVRVTCLGEVHSDGAYDGGWIENVDTGEQVWQFDGADARAAGGAAKNQSAEVTLDLPAGRYAVGYATDGSHSGREFNAPPPDDPLAWGIVVRPETPADAASVVPFTPDNAGGPRVLAEMVKARSRTRQLAGFTLRRPCTIRVVALGEGMRGEMYDRGWIIDARSRATVWELDYDNSEHAGGAEKNRVEQRVLELPAGSYVVHYAADGSHAWGDWNAAPPLRRSRWGITVTAIDPGFRPEDVAPFDPDADAGPALVRLTRVGDDEERDATFTLERATDVEVHALGEASGRRLADRGWIEDAGTGATVWEMRREDTSHAGGAEKNREVRATVHLPAGTYRVRYRTDDSHAFGEWNTSPPRDPESWGITVTLAGEAPAGTVPAEQPPATRPPAEAPPRI